MLARLRKTQEENEGGFTLIELLVVVIIIGILAAIAIPTFLNQREKAWQKAAVSDLRNIAVQLENVDAGYPAVAANSGAFDTALGQPVKYSQGVSFVSYVNSSGAYCVQVAHASLPAASRNYAIRSADGRPKQVVTTVTDAATQTTAC